MQNDWNNLRRAALLEGTTLIILLGVAVPLKHLAGYPMPVSVMGPVHGIAFLLYGWLLLRTAAAGQWRRSDVARAGLAALLPFGAWLMTARLQARDDD